MSGQLVIEDFTKIAIIYHLATDGPFIEIIGLVSQLHLQAACHSSGGWGIRLLIALAGWSFRRFLLLFAQRAL